MTRTRARRLSYVATGILVAAFLGVATGCQVGSVLKVPLPVGVSGNAQLSNRDGADESYDGAKFQLFNAVDAGNGSGVVLETGLFTDELTWSNYTNSYSAIYGSGVDARYTVARGGSNGIPEPGDYVWQNILQARVSLVHVLPDLQAYEPPSTQSKVGEAYALIGYSELFVAEMFCDGTPLSDISPSGGVQYGAPLADSALLRIAEMQFDSALKYAAGADSVTNLASVGLGRALLDRGLFDSAALAVANVPSTFVYNGQQPPNNNVADQWSENAYAIYMVPGNPAQFNVSDQEGVNGLDFISANDPRLTFNTSMSTIQGTTWELPNKFYLNPAYIPMATGVEGALIQAEAALHDGNTTMWLAGLNSLRNGNSNCTDMTNLTCPVGTGQTSGQTTGLYSLTDPVLDTARVSLMFRERAFWLFGQGSRLGDLRRLVRQYGRSPDNVYPTGAYANGTNPVLSIPIPNYGTDVVFTLPTSGNSSVYFVETNPNYKGCLTSTTSA